MCCLPFRQDIHGWCYDRGALATWNLARASLEPSKADRLIPTDSCLTACCFHPEAVVRCQLMLKYRTSCTARATVGHTHLHRCTTARVWMGAGA